MKALIVIFLCFAVSVQKSYAFRCIKCDTNETAECADPFDSSLTEKYSVDCAQAIQEQAIQEQDEEVINGTLFGKDTKYTCTKFTWNGIFFRDCSIGSESFYCGVVRAAKEEFLEEAEKNSKFICKVCEKELCNTGIILGDSSHVFSILWSFVFLLRRIKI